MKLNPILLDSELGLTKLGMDLNGMLLGVKKWKRFCICGSTGEKFSHLPGDAERPLLCVRVLKDDSIASRNRCHSIPMDRGTHLLHRLWASTGTG